MSLCAPLSYVNGSSRRAVSKSIICIFVKYLPIRYPGPANFSHGFESGSYIPPSVGTSRTTLRNILMVRILMISTVLGPELSIQIFRTPTLPAGFLPSIIIAIPTRTIYGSLTATHAVLSSPRSNLSSSSCFH